MWRRKSRRQLRAESLEARLVLDSTVVINEIMFNPAGPEDARMEFIELYNQLKVDIDISEWRLEGAVDYEFPDGTFVPGRGHLVVATAPASLQAVTGIESVLGPWEGRLSNGGERIRLYNNDHRLMNEVDYDDEGDWPDGPDGSGLSLSKFDQLSASHLADNWTFSRQIGGTPGRDNFVPQGLFNEQLIVAGDMPISAFVPTNNDLGLSWIAPDFDDSGWLQGTAGVGYDARDAYNEFFGLDLDDPPNEQEPMPVQGVSTSVFVRYPFNLDRDPAEFDHLDIQLRVEDGFVAYLNGQEWTSFQAPEHEQNVGLPWDADAERSHADALAVKPKPFDLLERQDILRRGENMLAVHLLNRRLTDNDLLFHPESIVAKFDITPDQLSKLRINEIAGGSAPGDFFVEIINQDDQDHSLDGLSLVSHDVAGANFPLPNVTLAAGERWVVDASQFTADIGVGDHIQLTGPDGAMDVRRLTGRLEGFDEATGHWQYPSAPTPGTPNTMDVDRDLVINEIMYHAPLTPGKLESAPTFRRTVLVPLSGMDWRYNQAGVDLGADWYKTTHQVDNDQWFSGTSPLGYSTTNRIEDLLQTVLVEPRSNDPQFLTHYFETEFEITADELTMVELLEASLLIDDGAVVYLNGVELLRQNMPDGEVAFDTAASSTLSTASPFGPRSISPDLLQVGTNVLSVEVHQDRLASRDIVMAVSLTRGEKVEEAKPGVLAQRNQEEWFELYNRGTEPIDLTGWSVRDAVRFDFADGTVIQPGGYLVVSNDRESLQAKWPDIRIVGNFDGTLSNRDDRIRLLDPSENLVDDVHYYESGRWASSADGGGNSLELRDPMSDNSRGEAWGVSDQSDASQWVNHSRRGVSELDVTGTRVHFNEFILGLLGEGEFLLDDVSVIQDPDGQAISVLQNGTFEDDELGASPDKWRLIGNHFGQVVVDPTDANNNVLHVTATGAQAHLHDHVETTFVDGSPLVLGVDYEISFRAKWISGSSQLNSRLFFHRLPDTLNLHVPEHMGTPGTVNDAFVSNMGPTYDGLAHEPVMPRRGQEATVSVDVDDVHGVETVELWWRPDGGDWNSTSMLPNVVGTYQGTIPGQESSAIVQFYVAATDRQGAQSFYPDLGPDSRALIQISDGKGPSTPIDTIRLVMMQEERDLLYSAVNRMSNQYRPATLLHNSTVFYDVDVRQVGSRWIRPNSGYKVRMNPQQPFYGVHDSIRLDLNGMAEIMMKQMINRAGGSSVSYYDDIAYLVTPDQRGIDHTHEILLNLARLENVFLNEQFVDGSSGTKWELDDVVYPTGGGRDRQSPKTGTEVITTADIGVDSETTYEQGNDPEFYRAHLLIKSRRADDRFDVIKQFAHAIHTSGDELFDAANEVMDVDLWMRHYANQAYFGNWDTYGFGRPKNLRMYQRPSDGRMIPFFWDCDLCNFTEPLLRTTESTSRLDEIRDIPHNLRLYWGHMLDFVNRSFNEQYVARWAQHYGEMAGFATHGGDENFNSIVTSTARRSASVVEAVHEAIPEVPFEITTPDGIAAPAGGQRLLLEGTGWVNVREIRLVDSGEHLDAFWPTTQTWQIQVPISPGATEVAVEAVDFFGNVIAVDAVRLGDVQQPALPLRVTEINYNPTDANAAETQAGFVNDDFEFIEIQNIGSQPVSLTDVQLRRVNVDGNEQGVEFDFDGSPVTSLAPGEHVVVVENLAAFVLRYGQVANVAGEWSGRLNNQSETLTLAQDAQLIQQFTYNDQWHPDTDGQGATLVIVNANSELDRWNEAAGWRPSIIPGGSPGAVDRIAGDSNGDGVFDLRDLELVFQLGEFDDDIAGNSTFEEGDWDGDGDFTADDLLHALSLGHYRPPQ